MSNSTNETVPPVHDTPPQPPPRVAPPGITDGDTMERLFQALFYRIAVLYARTVPKHIRRIAETAVLVLAIVCMVLLIYLHVVFNRKPMACLSHLQDQWPRHGVLRVELFFESPPEDYDLQQSYAKELQHGHVDGYDYYEKNDTLSKAEEKNLAIVEIPVESSIDNPVEDAYTNASIISSLQSSIDPSTKSSVKHKALEYAEIHDDEVSSEFNDDQENESFIDYFFNFDWAKQLLFEEHYILEYSIEYGFLRLSPETRKRLNIEVLLVTLDITNDTCFGNGLNRLILDQFLGYQDILMSNIKQLAEKEVHKGYVRNVMTNDHFRFVSTSQNRRLWTYLVALCIMIVFTVSISMLLRYSHFQIFLFIIDLLRMIEHNTSIVFPAAPLLTVILALIGMEAIMSEFFSDASTAFYVILVVWISDQYDTICCHTPISKHHWVRFFYIYHFAFYAYHARYSGQYSGLALVTSCCFIVHSMFYFFHHFELPVIEAQLVHIFVDQNVISQTQQTNREDDPTTATAP